MLLILLSHSNTDSNTSIWPGDWAIGYVIATATTLRHWLQTSGQVNKNVWIMLTVITCLYTSPLSLKSLRGISCTMDPLLQELPADAQHIAQRRRTCFQWEVRWRQDFYGLLSFAFKDKDNITWVLLQSFLQSRVFASMLPDPKLILKANSWPLIAKIKDYI